jgi:hypothetical protein
MAGDLDVTDVSDTGQADDYAAAPFGSVSGRYAPSVQMKSSRFTS